MLFDPKIDPEVVDQVLMADGWHHVHNHSFDYDYDTGFTFEEKGSGAVIAGPTTSVLAVKVET